MKELRESISDIGLRNPIALNNRYQIIDGLHRWEACKALGHKTIACTITNASDLQVLLQQVVASTPRVEIKPYEHSKHLQRILEMSPHITIDQLAEKLSRSTQWLKNRLSLNKLSPLLSEKVDSGQVSLVLAYALAKLDPEIQDRFLPHIINLKQQDAIGIIASVHDGMKAVKLKVECDNIVLGLKESKKHLTLSKDQYRTALGRLVKLRPHWSAEDISKLIDKPVEWVRDMMNEINAV